MNLYCRLICVAIGICVAAPAASRNMVSNSSCEWEAREGELPECWKVWMQHPGSSNVGADGTVAKIGSWSLRIVNPGTGGANTAGADIRCEPNTDYTLSVHVRSLDAVGAQVTLGAKDGDGKILTWNLGGGQAVPANSDWIRLVHRVTTPADCAYLTPHLTNNGGTTWWDACQLERGTKVTAYVDSEPPSLPALDQPVPGVNAIPNPGFENDLPRSAWQALNPSGDTTGAATWDATVAHDGLRSLTIASVTKTRRWQSRLIPIDPASTYRLSAWLRTAHLEGRADVYLDCYGVWLTAVGRAGYDGGIYAYEDCGWTERYAIITPDRFPRTAKYARVVCAVTGTLHATGQAWFDDLALTMESATLNLKPRSVGERASPSIFRPEDSIAYELTVHAPGAAQVPLTAQFTVTDYFDVMRTSGRLPVVCDAEDNATVSIDVPALNATGYFALTVALDRGEQHLGRVTQSFGLTLFDPAQWASDEASHFGICHLKNERMYSLAQIAGMKWTRGGGNPSWQLVQPKADQWTWTPVERTVSAPTPFGIHKLIILSGIPPWASQGPDEFFTFFRRPTNKRYRRLPQNLADFGNYVYEVVKRYKDRFTYWEIWNEADIAFWQGTDEEYIQLMQVAYQAAKRADSTCQVSMTGLAYPFPHTNRTGRLCDGRAFLEKCLKLAPDEFDIVNFHSYGGMKSLDRKLTEIAELMRQYGCTKPVWITETGMPTHLRGATEQDQARYCAQAYATALAAGVAKIFWHCFHDWGVDPNYNEHHFGLIHYDYSPKPAYMVYCAMTRELAGAAVAGPVDLGPGIRAVSFDCDTKPITMIWSETDRRRVLLKLDAEHADLTDLMGNGVALDAPMRIASLELTPDPVYLKGARVLSCLGPVVKLQEGLMLRPGETLPAAMSIINRLDIPATGECTVSAPAGWTVAPRRVSFEIAAGATRSVPLLVTASQRRSAGRVGITCDLHIGTLTLPGIAAGSVMLALPIDSAPRTVMMDAALSEWPAESALTVDDPARVVQGVRDNGADLGARFWLAGDRQALFLAVEVRDDCVANYRRYNEPWSGDAIEFFLDLRQGDQLGRPEHTDGVYQFFLIPPDDRTARVTWRLWQPKSPFTGVLDLVAARSNDGYTLEARIPWRSFGPHTPHPGQAIGMDVCLDDADGTDPSKREAQMAWAGTVRNHVDASNFARGLLAADPPPIAVTGAAPENLAPNPGFEVDIDENGVIDAADGWRGLTADWGDTTGTWDWDGTVAHGGTASVSIRDVTTHRVWESADLPVLAAMSYSASAWIKTKDLDEGVAQIYLACFTSAGKWVGNVARSKTVSGTSDWQQVHVQVPAGACPAEATVMRIELSLRNAPRGTAWFDDMTFAIAPE